ncbi:MAG: class F sortase [Candidatus Peribacteraceae bacterium]|nr:class F sortase [Candidatus Peribacteraceae bacterium]
MKPLIAVIVFVVITVLTDGSTRHIRRTDAVPSVARGVPINNRTPSSVTQAPVGIPLRLRIPHFGIDAAVEQVGLTASGDLAVPSAWSNVGWYLDGPRPGEIGTAVIDGHLDSETGAAVFWNLPNLRTGDVVEIDDDRGRTLRFSVTGMRNIDDDDATAAAIAFGTTAQPTGSALNLITCTGTWNPITRQYNARLVVFTQRDDTLPEGQTGAAD